MALKDMAYTKAEAEKEYGDCGPCSTSDGDDDDGPRYPWGMTLHLDQVSLDKLGIGLIPVGSEITLVAKATITGTSSRERLKGEQQQDMDVQITALDLSMNMSTPDRQSKAAGKLYG